ncbi:MAG: glutathione S-transferase family protein [Myxococcota bacterium]
MIKLYGIPMSRAGRCLWALEEVGVEYENVSTNFTTDAKKPEYLAINPNGRIPTLVDGDTTLFESMAINLYLARKYDAGLQPKSIEDEARALQWSFWGMTELEPHLIQMLLNRVMRPEAERVPAEAEAAEQVLQKPLKVLDGALSDRSYLLGDTFSIADLNVASVLSVAAFVRLDVSGFPNVARWLGACTSRPAFKRAQG